MPVPAVPTTAPLVISEWFILPQHWPAQVDLLTWCQHMTPGAAALLVIGGIIYIGFGWYLYKALVTLNAALVGAYVGALIGQKTGAAVPGAMLGGFTAAAITWPLMKWAVAVMGGLFGALLGASIWRAVGLEPNLAWAGGGMGLIFFGLISFILFRGSVMMFTSLQGSVMLIFGVLGLAYKYPDIAQRITDQLIAKPFILPATIFVPTIVGLIFQQTHFTQPEAKK
jgi:hypothetical protein